VLAIGGLSRRLRITPTLLAVDSEPLPPGLWVPLVALVIAGPIAAAVMDREGWLWGVVAAGIGGMVCGILLRVWSRGRLGRTRSQGGDRPPRQARRWRNPVTGALIATVGLVALLYLVDLAASPDGWIWGALQKVLVLAVLTIGIVWILEAISRTAASD
jgi:hypothetical protein